MGDVAITFQVMPEGNEVDLEKLREDIDSRIDPRSFEEEPVAFGLKALKVMKVIPEDAGGPDEFEDKIKDIDGVQNVKVVDQRKLL